MNELVLPSGYISRQWIDAQYAGGIKAAQELNSSVSRQQIEARLSTLAATPGGLNLVGKELRSPLLREMLYESRGRNLSQVYKLSQGESAEFWSDIAVPAAAIGVEGLPVQYETTSDYTRVDTRLFAANPYVRWNMSNLTKFDILNATQQRGKASLMLQEAAAWFRLVRYASGLRSGQGTTAGLEGTSAASQNAAASIAGAVTVGSNFRITVAQLAQAIADFGSRLIDGQKKLWINPSHIADLMLFNSSLNTSTGGFGFFAPNTQEMILQKGNVGNFMGMEIYSDIVVPYNETRPTNEKTGVGSENVVGYILGPAEYVGVTVIRTDLSVETLKDATRFADVFALWSDVGFYIRWVKALQRLTV